MGSCQSIEVNVIEENLNNTEAISDTQVAINTLTCKPMVQYYNQKFPPEPMKFQITATTKPDLKNQEEPQFMDSQSSTQKGILKIQQSQSCSLNTQKKRVSFDKEKKRLSDQSIKKKGRKRRVTMEMLESTF